VKTIDQDLIFMVLNQGGGPNFGHQVMMMQVHHQEEEEGLDSPGKRSYRSWFHGESNMPS
jgi:hypothetical protein